VLGDPIPPRGSFLPVRTPAGLVVFARDHGAAREVAAMRREGPYRDNGRDAGHELPQELVGQFVAGNGARCGTGYKYWRRPPGGLPGAPGEPYDPAFLESRRASLEAAAAMMPERPVSLCAFNADDFGFCWHEGPHFLESLFRIAAERKELEFVAPSEYLSAQPDSTFAASMPGFSSWGENGYAERWLDSSGDWMYRHLSRACGRMIEMTERFSGDSWVRERALNQAARELLLAQAADWPAMMRRQDCEEFARAMAEGALRNFNAIYDAMSSSHISAEWLTDLETQRGIFPDINYRVFKRKR
jgi:1,4-alpha-glucan branching enzyme